MREAFYYAPTELAEAVTILADYRAKAAVLAGGTDLLPKLNYYEVKPQALIYIGRLGLRSIHNGGAELIIGATTTTADLAQNELVHKYAPALAQAARLSGSIAIQNAATIGGNIANASPAADLVAALLAMDASARLVSHKGQRDVSLADFFLGPHHTILEPDELITQVHIPVSPGKVEFLKLGRRKGQTLAVVSAAVRLQMDGNLCQDVRVVLGSMAPTPLRCRMAENLLRGQKITQELIHESARRAIAESSPITDQRATAWYRRKAGEALVRRAIQQALDKREDS